MQIAVQMDPIENIDIKTDSTFRIMLEAQKRDYSLFVYNVNDLSLKNNKVIAYANKIVKLQNKANHHVSLLPKKIINLSSFDVILMRQDPPFNMSYITATHILEKIKSSTLIINDPSSVRNSPEKLMVTRFNDIIPSTLISRCKNEILKFRKKHLDIIMKPLYGNGGKDVFLIKQNDPNFQTLLDKMLDSEKEPLILQEYLSKVTQGDKRILLIDGKPVGAVNRLPKKNEVRSNLHVGGKPKKTSLTKNDLFICDKIGPFLKEKGLVFTGIDIIDNKLTEINVTSPTCIQEIDFFNQSNISSLLWNAIENKL